mmetsp:Transcript_773/g.1541  ORF Transcript_773/g.1541 Transcript_773/m.1541 type:complete len:254 (-) Transcript_773:82-843(-)
MQKLVVSFLFSLFVGPAACVESQACVGSSCALEEDEAGLQMVQLKKSAIRQPGPPCLPPDNKLAMARGKDCPKRSHHDTEGSTCLNGNKPYSTMAQAWEDCGKIKECGAVMQNVDYHWYLRRHSDPDTKLKGQVLYAYNCVPTWISGSLFKTEHEQCGYDWNDPACRENNYAFVNGGLRHKHDVWRNDALAICGQICVTNSTDCGGFWWDQEDNTCYFRKNARCGLQRTATGGDCYVKESEADSAVAHVIGRV